MNTDENISEFAYEIATGKIMVKCFSNPISDEHKNEYYGRFWISFPDWVEKFQTLPKGYAPYFVDGNIEIRELPEFKDYHKRIKLENEMAELKQYLNETDYVVAKINEAMIYDYGAAEILKQQYSKTLQKRIDSRNRIVEIEGLLSEGKE